MLVGSAMFAQTTGVIVGRVVDSSGAGVPKVRIELINQNTGIRETATGTNQGEYVLPRVEPGKYSLSASAPGFKTSIKTGVEILVNQTAREDISLAIGDAATSVQVAAELPVVQSETSSIGQVVDGKQVSQMPLNGRDSIYALLATIPGVQNSGLESGDCGLIVSRRYVDDR